MREHFHKLRQKYLDSGELNPQLLEVNANTLLYQVPGGMLSNLLSQLKEAKQEHRLDEVLQEVPRVRQEAGYPPLVTPSSQIVGTQAVLNVVLGKRYQMVTKEFKALIAGEYGASPAPIEKEFAHKILGDHPQMQGRFADTLAPELEKLKEEVKPYAIQPEDLLTYAMFPQVALKFFQRRKEKMLGIDGQHVDYVNKSHPV